MISPSKSALSRLLALGLGLALIAAFPSMAAAQSPTDEQYECGVLGVTADGEECEPPRDSSTSGTPDDDSSTELATAPGGSSNSGGGPGASELPFTGLDAWGMLAIGAGLIGVGLAFRRVQPQV